MARPGVGTTEAIELGDVVEDHGPPLDDGVGVQRYESSWEVAQQDACFDVGNPMLDPNDPAFNARAWAKALYHARYTARRAAPRKAGFAFRDLSVYGYGTATDYQASVGNVLLKMASRLASLVGIMEKRQVNILHDLHGLVLPGEQLCVLGPPGSGCSTFLKTIAGETAGLKIGKTASINYHGISSQQMGSRFRGEAIYTAEDDQHFPMLSVSDTLYFAALARTPREIPGGLKREQYARNLCDSIIAMFGISHIKDSPVGNNFIRGVSGGERKRVTIAEAALSQAPLQCWDNSTRGLDSANAVEFCKTLRLQSDVFGITSCVAIYQAPQAAYDSFDKVLVLFEGRQIFFGKTCDAAAYFTGLGFEQAAGQTVPDFLTSMTNPSERIVRQGFECTVPNTADEFAQRWRNCKEQRDLLEQIELYGKEHPFNGPDLQQFAAARNSEKSARQRAASPYTVSYARQISLCMWREWQQVKKAPGVVIFTILIALIQNVILGSVFFDLPDSTSSFFRRGAVMFMVILFGALSGMLEVMALYDKRPMIEKHNRYALYHPSADAIASMLIDLPRKMAITVFTTLVVYFMANLRQEPGPFFFYLLISFMVTLAMSMFFRCFASMTRTVAQAMAPTALINLALSLYAGFAIAPSYMRGWASWIRYINPIFYAFEAIMVNELHGRELECTGLIPSGPLYQSVAPEQHICPVVGSVPGSGVVSGDAFLAQSYGYYFAHRWRNFAILLAFTIFFCLLHLVVCEFVTAERSKGEVLVFLRGRGYRNRMKEERVDEEQTSSTLGYPGSAKPLMKKMERDEQHQRQESSAFHWEDLCYDIKVNGKDRQLLDHVDGWIKPGSLTALMGVSGAGKTTLLDVLARRTTIGMVSGGIFVDGQDCNASFQGRTAYVQQQDLHLATSTVREALQFSSLLRQPNHYSRQEKLDYVDTVIDMLGMSKYADAIVGIPGSGLNVEQRKRLSIGVELAARPELLVFLDEPTSGLDSQTSWSICDLMEKLTNSGQAILCTIHQPSAMLFQRFDSLLLLTHGGKTVYFGEIGRNSKTLTDYFVRNGGTPCPPSMNPAEYMLEIIGAAPGAQTDIDWPSVWRNSAEYQHVQQELSRLRKRTNAPKAVAISDSRDQKFAAPFGPQLWLVTLRLFRHLWRTPAYIVAKILITAGCAFFIGFSFFNGENTNQGLQNQMFGVLMFLFILIHLVLQIVPEFIIQRTLYEARERQSKTYSWQSFILSNILVEAAWNSLMAILCFVVWYYPMGVWRNAEYTDELHSRSVLVLLILWQSLLFATSFAYLVVSGFDNDQAASGLLSLLNMMAFLFCGILAGPEELPGFWIFMYRASPYTYVTSSFLSSTLANAPMHCAPNELLSFSSPAGQTCQEYMDAYIAVHGGYLVNPDGRGAGIGSEECQYCQMDKTNQYLDSMSVQWSTRWRDFGLVWVYIVFNVGGAVLFYYLFRVPKGKGKKSGQV